MAWFQYSRVRFLSYRVVPVSLVLGCGVVFAQKHIEPLVEKLKPGDKILAQVFEEPSLSGPLEVSPSSTINFPLLGQIPVKGMTTDEVAGDIKKRLEDGYIRSPKVSVNLVGRKASSVMVIGQVRRPGPVEFQAGGELDLFTAVATAGGAAEESADTSKIEIKRRNGDSIENLFANLEKQKEMALRDGDTEIVKAKAAANLKLVTVLGCVSRPGTIQMFTDRDMDILSAIANAGGLTPMANSKRVTVRHEAGDPETARVDKMQRAEIPALILKAGDTIFVPESIF
jgi:polysaccharide biosynthesis/export protein